MFKEIPQTYHPAITGLRGLAILGMFFNTMGQALQASGTNFHLPIIGTVIGIFAQKSFAYIFFTITGFTIFNSLKRQFNIPRFFWHRFSKIVPAYLLVFSLFFLIAPIFDNILFRGLKFVDFLQLFFTNLLFLSGAFDFPAIFPSFIGLSYILLFNTFALAYFILRRVKNQFVQEIGSIALILTIALFTHNHPEFAYFFIGVIAFYSQRFLVSNEFFQSSVSFVFFFGSIMFWAIGLNFLGYFLFVSSFFSVLSGHGKFVRILRSKFFQFFGKISYSFFLLHGIIIIFVSAFMKMEFFTLYSIPVRGIFFILFASTLSIWLSRWMYFLFEVKLLQRLRRHEYLEEGRAES